MTSFTKLFITFLTITNLSAFGQAINEITTLSDLVSIQSADLSKAKIILANKHYSFITESEDYNGKKIAFASNYDEAKKKAPYWAILYTTPSATRFYYQIEGARGAKIYNSILAECQAKGRKISSTDSARNPKAMTYECEGKSIVFGDKRNEESITEYFIEVKTLR